MILALIAALLGALGVLWFPAAWQGGAIAGWSLAWAAEWALHRRRLWVMDPAVPQTAFAAVLAIGFLGRLALLLAGALTGSSLALYAPAPFLLSFLSAVLIGEAVLLPNLLRQRASASGPPALPADQRDPLEL